MDAVVREDGRGRGGGGAMEEEGRGLFGRVGGFVRGSL